MIPTSTKFVPNVNLIPFPAQPMAFAAMDTLKRLDRFTDDEVLGLNQSSSGDARIGRGRQATSLLRPGLGHAVDRELEREALRQSVCGMLGC